MEKSRASEIFLDFRQLKVQFKVYSETYLNVLPSVINIYFENVLDFRQFKVPQNPTTYIF